MNVEFTHGTLDTNEDWARLAEILGGAVIRVVPSIIRHLITINAKSYLVEAPYIDRDYSSDYRQFYSQTFRTYGRHCTRVHFFAEDVGEILRKADWAERVAALNATTKKSYCGFCVVRPLPGAPVGRTVLLAKGPAGADIESAVTCRAVIRANLLGAELDVIGTSFMQQDSRVGACAQVAIWTGARHLHQRHRYNWLSVADITRLAAPTAPDEATSLPAGSDFLTSERMIRAINEMGFQPLCFDKANIGAAILPYVESGVPVILGLSGAGALGHAVTVIGRVFAQPQKPTAQAIDYIGAFIVHDDQRGPYMLVPMSAGSAATHNFDANQIINNSQGQPLDITNNAFFGVALMPTRAFSTAKAAEITARARIDATLSDMSSIRAKLTMKGADVNERLIEELITAHKNKTILLRTYLTSAAGYRRHIALGTGCDELKDVLLCMHLPHFTWVTEISSIDSYNQVSPGLRRIYGHSVLDATSSGKDATGLLMLHLPGMVTLRNVNPKEGQEEETVVIIENDRLYECREQRPDL